jgi:hypothetical protein
MIVLFLLLSVAFKLNFIVACWHVLFFHEMTAVLTLSSSMTTFVVILFWGMDVFLNNVIYLIYLIGEG